MIVKMIFGSHLYGTETEKSDKDFKGIYFPSKEEIFLGKIQKSRLLNTKSDSTIKNSASDMDYEIYSLHYFIKMACDGETATIDMLHAPSSMLIETSDIWSTIVSYREKFYTKNLNSLFGYARKQAAKYGIKGSRLNTAKLILNCLDNYPPTLKLKEIWDDLPEGEHIIKNTSPNEFGIMFYEFCGKKIGHTCSVDQLYSVVHKFYKEYGARAQQAALDNGIDWKAISHALRAGYQIREILQTKNLVFPLKEAEYLKEVKQGKHSFKVVEPILENLLDEVETLSEKSDLPDEVDKVWWENFLIKTIEDSIF